jgi:hypothetical protein
VGINIAAQDAVAAANRLASPLRNGKVSDDDLQAIQERRTLPVRSPSRGGSSAAFWKASDGRSRRCSSSFWYLSGSAPHSGPVDRSRYSSRARVTPEAAPDYCASATLPAPFRPKKSAI